MTLVERLSADLTRAMKDRDRVRLDCIRMLRSRLQEREVAGRSKQGLDYKLTDDEALDVVSAYAKQRRESIVAFREGGREEAAVKEEAELAVIQTYLPEALSESELRRIVGDAVTRSGAQSPRDMGKVMQIVMPQIKGRADGKQVNRIVQELLKG